MARGMFSLRAVEKSKEADKNIASLFLKRIEEAVIQLDDDYKPSSHHTPSSMICVRQMYFKRKGVTPEAETKSASMIGILESGTARHDAIQRVLDKMDELGMEFKYMDVEEYIKENDIKDIDIIGKTGMETKCYNTKYGISFLTDGIILHKPTGEYFIFEYKTEVTQKFTRRDKQELVHETQGAAYGLSFNINKTLFVYEDRNFCNKKCFEYVVTDEDKINKVVAKIESCEEHIKNGTVPPKVTNKDIDPTFVGGKDRSVGPSAKVCLYCKYKEECQKYV